MPNNNMCDDCPLHDPMVRGYDKRIDGVCKKYETLRTEIKEDHREMWTEIRKRVPRWAFVLTVTVSVLIFGAFGTAINHLHGVQNTVRDQATHTATVLESELEHIKDSVDEIKQRLR